MKKYLLALALLFAASAGLAVAEEHRVIKIGGMAVIALADVPNMTVAPNEDLLVGLPEAKKGTVTTAEMAGGINTFIVDLGDQFILFDTGLGEDGEMQGRLLSALASANMLPGDIDAVCITHFHFDHVGGLVKDGKPVFANANLFVPRVEVESDPASFAKFKTAYADRLSQFDWGVEVLPGVHALDASGHTAGHTAFLVELNGDRLLVAGDVIHFGGLQLPNPDIAVTYDTTPAEAIAARKRIFDLAIAENLPVATMHLPFPGLGKLAKAGEGYTFVELE